MRISVRNITKSYHDAQHELVVLRELNCDFEGGKSIAVVGKSGVGKSTLLHLLGGLDRPTSGKVMFGDTDIFALPSDKLTAFRGANVGFIFQFHHLLPGFNAMENVAMPLSIAGVGDDVAYGKASEILTAVGLAERASHRPSQLSGGEQQRVAIARALVAQPKVVLADEPTGNLDFQTAEQVQQLLKSVCALAGATLVVVTHNLELAHTLDRIFEMRPGGELAELTGG